MNDETPGVETVATPPQTHTIQAVLTVHQDFTIQADTPEQAEKRLRWYLADPELVASGLVKHEGAPDVVRWQIRKPKKK